jgi:hypothetical protein
MGTISLVHRYYDPATGQFVSVDPLADVTGTPYAYSGGDPVNGSDPSGLSGNATDAACDGGEAPPNGETTAQACAAAQQNARQVTSFELGNQGSAKPVYGPIGTIGVCVNLSGGWGIFGSVSGCIALVGGHPTLIGTTGGGGSSPTGSLTLGLLVSNANNPHNLRGIFVGAGGSADLGVSAGGEGSIGSGSCNQTIWQGQLNVGFGLDLPVPFETHGGVSKTWTWSP